MPHGAQEYQDHAALLAEIAELEALRRGSIVLLFDKNYEIATLKTDRDKWKEAARELLLFVCASADRGYGPRNCMARGFSRNEIATAATHYRARWPEISPGREEGE